MYNPPGNIKERQLIETADTNSKINPMSSINAAPKTSNKNRIMLTAKYVEVAISLYAILFLLSFKGSCCSFINSSY